MRKTGKDRYKSWHISLLVFVIAMLLTGLSMSTQVMAAGPKDVASLRINGQENNLIAWARESEDGIATYLDGKGGSATYCLATNTLTLNNFWLDADPDVPYAIRFHEMGDVTITLIGMNHIYSTYEIGNSGIVPFCIMSNYDTSLSFRGPGRLDAKEGILAGNVCEIRDCKITIHSTVNGIHGNQGSSASIQNSEIDIIVEGDDLEGHHGAMSFGSLEIQNSIVKLQNPSGHPSDGYSSTYIARALETDYSKGPIVLGEDMIMTDMNGKMLCERKLKDQDQIIQPFSLIYSTEGKWTPYTKDGADGSYGRIIDNYMNATTTVVIRSANKESSLKLDAKMEKLSGMDMNTDAYGALLAECEKDQAALSEQAKKLLADPDAISDARKAYDENNAEKAQQVEEKIKDIGTVTEESQTKIEEAQKAYEKLTQDQKDRVGNAELLISAGEKYREIIEQKRIQEETKDPAKGDTDSSDPNETISSKIKKNKITYIKSKKKKQITLKWKKDKACRGYQISYSTDKKFKKNTKTKTIKKYKTTKVTLTKLKSRKTYYIRIREYQLDGKKKAYGAWSAVKKIKVK